MMISYLLLLVMVMIGLAYYTMLERKSLSYIQDRKGPNKVGYVGLFQPLVDGGKLFMKEWNLIMTGNKMMFMLSPLLGLFLMFLFWSFYLNWWDLLDMKLGLVMFLCISSMNVYVVMISGWSSNSMYGMSGSYRGVAQMISYEVVLALLMMGMVMMIGSYNLMDYCDNMFWVSFLMFLVWLSTSLAESNRSPYDFVEGESELVSGYNVEYSSIGFSMLFMGEYGMILMLAYMSGLIFFGDGGGLSMLIISIFMLWVRGSFPRFRYDKLSEMSWKVYLYFSLCYLLLMGGFSSILGYMMS